MNRQNKFEFLRLSLNFFCILMAIGLFALSVCGQETTKTVSTVTEHVHTPWKETLIGFNDGKYEFCCICESCGAEYTKYYDAVVTFVDDDGKADAVNHWERIVDATGIKMNCCLITGKVNETPGKSSYTAYTDWETVARCKEKGIEFVSHTDGHIKLTEHTEEELRRDFERSKATLQEHGLRDDILVYPFLAYNNETISIVQEYFSMGVGGLGWTNAPETDPYRIDRIGINNTKVRQEHSLDGTTVSSYTIKTTEKLRQHVQEAIKEKHWLVFKSHAYNSKIGYWFDEQDEQTIIELCRYIQSLPNVKIITLSEAYSILNTEVTDHTLYAPDIRKQPQSVEVASEGRAATTKIIADGEKPLTYQWYVKNPGATSFSKSSSTSDWYSVKVTAKISGRQVYCVVTDKNGKTSQSEVATLSIKKSEDENGEILVPDAFPGTGCYPEYAGVIYNVAGERSSFREIDEGALYYMYDLDGQCQCLIKPCANLSASLDSIRLAMFGDSITWGRDSGQTGIQQTDCTLANALEQNLGISASNFGVGSQGWLVAAGKPKYSAYEKVAATDLSGYNCFTLAWGVNDYSSVKKNGFELLGTYDSTDEATLIGQMYLTVSYLRSQVPDAMIIVIPPWNGTNFGKSPDYKYTEAGYLPIIREMAKFCQHYGVFFLDMEDSPLNKWTLPLVMKDGVHPNSEGYRLIGDWLSWKLAALWTSLYGHATPTDATPTDATPTDATPTDATPTDAKPEFSLGDVDGDGEITSGDARLALRASVGLEHCATGSVPFAAADVNHNGEIGSDDARLILRASVGLETLG